MTYKIAKIAKKIKVGARGKYTDMPFYFTKNKTLRSIDLFINRYNNKNRVGIWIPWWEDRTDRIFSIRKKLLAKELKISNHRQEIVEKIKAIVKYDEFINDHYIPIDDNVYLCIERRQGEIFYRWVEHKLENFFDINVKFYDDKNLIKLCLELLDFDSKLNKIYPKINLVNGVLLKIILSNKNNINRQVRTGEIMKYVFPNNNVVYVRGNNEIIFPEDIIEIIL